MIFPIITMSILVAGFVVWILIDFKKKIGGKNESNS